jgi:Enoyl-CoA hydratase/isomerase
LYKSGKYKNKEYLDKLFRSLAALGDAVAGDSRKTKIPTITVPHGILTDGGYVWLRASYVMATQESCFRILNPSRGLSLDPVGLSYHLTRVGKEFVQTSQNYIRGCAFLMGLAGFEANNNDLIETGMATQSMDSPAGLGLLEYSLAEIVPWQAQALIKNPKQYYGRTNTIIHDGNAVFRNVQVGDLVRCFSDANADRRDFMEYDNNDFEFEDPSLDLDPVPWQVTIRSDLVEMAMALDYILRQAPDLKGRMRLIQELAQQPANNAQDEVMIGIAKELAERLNEQSPLALMVVHRLMELGSDAYAKLEDCVARERRVQMAMMEQPDFALWGKHNVDGDYTGPWHHKSVYEVSDDLVEEIVESQKEVANKQRNVNSLMFHNNQ